MTVEQLMDIMCDQVEIYISGETRPAYRGWYGFAPEELLKREVEVISGSHYYPYMSNDESVDCIEIIVSK